MNMKKKKDILIYILTLVLSVVFIALGYRYTSSKSTFVEKTDSGSVRARVVRIVEESEEKVDLGGGEVYTNVRIVFSAKVLDGETKGETIEATQVIDGMYLIKQNRVKPDNKVVLVKSYDEGADTEFVFAQFVRTDALCVLGAVFCVLLVLMGGFKGVNTLVSLAFTCLSVFLVLIPAVLSSLNIYFWSITVCVYITVMTLLLINGANSKSLAAGVGCVSGVVVSGALMKLMDVFLKLTGETDEHSIYISQLNPEDPIDLKALIFAMIIIGAVGAIMDVAMSMASALHELHVKNPSLNASGLFRSGMTIGKDMMGTMANTLVLAYMGSSLCTVLLLFVYDASLMEILNRELIVVEVLQALVGSMGILFSIPFTAFVASVLYAGEGDLRKKLPAPGLKEYAVEQEAGRSREPIQAENKNRVPHSERLEKDGISDYFDNLFPSKKESKGPSEEEADYLDSLY